MTSDKIGRRVAFEVAIITAVIGPAFMVVFNRFFQGRAVDAAKASISTVTIPDDSLRQILNGVVLVRTDAGQLATGFIASPRYVVTTINVLTASAGQIYVVRGKGTVAETEEKVSPSIQDATNQILILDLGREIRSTDLRQRQADVRVLDKVFAVAYGWGQYLSVPEGRIAKMPTQATEPIVADLLIDPGMAGGPVFDKDGALVGMVSAAIQGSSTVYVTPIARIEHLIEEARRP